MKNQIAKIIEDLHLLFVGDNGHETYGITVQSLKNRDKCKKEGVMYEWNINDFSLMKSDLSVIGLNEKETNELRNKIKK